MGSDGSSLSPKVSQPGHTEIVDHVSEKVITNGKNVNKKVNAEVDGKSMVEKVKTHEENAEDYHYGGYHPVYIGEEFHHRRYVVERKLGWGHFSTVWLAYDRAAKRRVALKVVRSAEHYRETSIDEIRILQKIREGDEKHLGKKHIISLLDYFVHRGPNGAHVCMVFEVLGENLLSLIQSYGHRGVPVGIVKQIAYQLLIALDYLHRECGIIHTDLKPENVLICIDQDALQHIEAPATTSSPTSNTSSSKTRNNTGYTAKAPIIKRGQSVDNSAQERKTFAKNPTKNSKPAGQVIPSSPFTSTLSRFPSLEGAVSEISLRDSQKHNSHPNSPFSSGDNSLILDGVNGSQEPVPKITVKIADLGNACWTRKHFTNDVQTRQYRSPEVILGCRWGASADCWSFACIIFELLTGDYLFDPRNGNSYSKEDDHIAQIIELLVNYPKQMALSGKHSRDLFNRRGELRNIHKLKFWPLKDVLEQKYHFSAELAQQISDFLSPMLCFDPAKRTNAGYMSNSPWLREVADPTFKIETTGATGEDVPGWATEIR
ncbi:SR protein-specific kinase Dsk1 [Schizosaccharomyces pombe]|uniref:Protein kinase dsk1 n=1 Tax=Schizosaccharomyces pombe (strain 972 / ATCC 24843) TaxID=284812 RepID=DSK1_SCHPO|nr:SR protein-specific kinase Dsk1 [Schizosaccharomyces pombe]P36616.2 RecName: Full=Protein kinase dsk1; AltName: Full=Dis1-suppressing protein kinase [Schizosaccharomyces pombe 972h-]CAA19180.1 SR protein-specific kinase Dsk1 [Schizosaccharomyces pombe]|eukprot:NP_595327.1 SR protein-specific kinase Dsk1 [Schizosaccharomyces pombe]